MAGAKARPVGINHVVLEVGNLDDALEFYGSIFDFKLRSRGDTRAFIDLGDQFIQLNEGKTQGPDGARHFGLAVDDPAAAIARLKELGVETLAHENNFRDPWGNRVEIVTYRTIQFTKSPEVLRGMGLDGLGKSPEAIEELAKKGMAPR
jgi:catechol-2,3-dioxygenase